MIRNFRKKFLLLLYEKVFDELQLELELEEKGVPPLSRGIADALGYGYLGWAGIF